MTPEERAEKALEEMEQIAKKYGVVISGCGCCGSPYLWVKNSSHELEYIRIGKDEE